MEQAYDVGEIRVVGAYQDGSGRKVIGLVLNASLNTCDGPPDDAWLPHWFSVSADTAFIGRELELVEVADFDGNGKSELLFWSSGYNNDGYVLLDDTLKHRAEVLWSYH